MKKLLAIVLAHASVFLGTAWSQVIVTSGGNTFGASYLGGGYAVGAVLPGVNVTSGGGAGYMNGGFGGQLGVGRGIWGVTRPTFMGEANAIAARFFSSGGVQLPVRMADSSSGQSGNIFFANNTRQSVQARQWALRNFQLHASPHPQASLTSAAHGKNNRPVGNPSPTTVSASSLLAQKTEMAPAPPADGSVAVLARPGIASAPGQPMK